MSEPQETSAAPSRLPVERVRAASLEVVAGPDTGRRARVDRPVFVVGKGESCDLRLSDPTVSREHVRFALTAGGLAVSDDGSKNGTLAAGLRIAQVTLLADTVLTLGGTTIAVTLDTGDTAIELSATDHFGGAFGRSSAMRHVFAALERAAPSNAPILLEGESGVGKDLLARAVHESSARAAAPFVTIDCGAISASLVESELFGHERGAFTGADRAREGVFQAADGGTLFLDEIGELPLDLQPKLLRALEAGEVRPVGGKARLVDVRIVAATNRRLGEAVQRGEFRSDLFYRLGVVRLLVPPLRDRREDVVPLATSFLRRTRRSADAELPPELAALLSSYAWPGNVRELRNVIERFALLGVTRPKDLFDATESAGGGAGDGELFDVPFQEARQTLVERFERRYLEHVLAACGGSTARAIARSGVPRPTFYRMMARLGLGRRADDP